MLGRLALISCLAMPLACAGDSGVGLDSIDEERFWQLMATLSEPPGEFEHDDNLVSNEEGLAQIVQRIGRRGGVFIGVGPEQNFSYIARLEPALAFIVDIRRDNRTLHLMYKALFELAPERADFVSRLFSRPRPNGVSGVSVSALFAAFDRVQPSDQLRRDTLKLVAERFAGKGFALPSEDMSAIETALRAFYTDGPDIRYGRAQPPSKTRPSYRTLMTARDLRGNPQSFLASEAAYEAVKVRQQRNLIVPVVGNFAGPHAIRRIADQVRAMQQVVSAFYGSNVEVYLTRDEQRDFCASLSTLPFDDETYFIGSERLQRLSTKLEACSRIAPSLRWP